METVIYQIMNTLYFLLENLGFILGRPVSYLTEMAKGHFRTITSVCVCDSRLWSHFAVLIHSFPNQTVLERNMRKLIEQNKLQILN